jgi:hypothetical protein
MRCLARIGLDEVSLFPKPGNQHLLKQGLIRSSATEATAIHQDRRAGRYGKKIPSFGCQASRYRFADEQLLGGGPCRLGRPLRRAAAGRKQDGDSAKDQYSKNIRPSPSWRFQCKFHHAPQ